MRKRTLPPIPDDGLVPIPHYNGPQLVTPEEAHKRAIRIMAGFDELPPAERHYLNYTNKLFGKYSPANSVQGYKMLKADATKREARTVKQLNVALF